MVELIRKWDFFSHKNIITLTISIIIIAKAQLCFQTAQFCLESIIFYMEEVSRCLMGIVPGVFLRAQPGGQCLSRCTPVSFLLNCLVGLLAIMNDRNDQNDRK